MKNLDPRRQRWMKVRVAILGALLAGGVGLVLRRVYELGVESSPMLREMAEAQYLRDVRLSPKRGTIYDRNGAELAVSVDVDSIWANPRELRRAGGDPATVAARLATAMTLDVATITARLGSDRYFVWIARRVTPGAAAAVRAMAIPGVGFEREARRFYPNRELASHVLGFANVDGVGIEGLELSYEERLRGSVRAVPAIRDRQGRVVFSEQLLDDRATQGDDVELTIDKRIQFVAERELALAVRTFEAKAGSVVVLAPDTGEILALASYPTFNPNDPSRASHDHRRNRAVVDRFEPGSTVKPFTVASAFAAGTIRSDQIIDCGNGVLEIGEDVIHDSHPYAALTPAQVLQYSSNIGTAHIAGTLGRRGLFRAFRAFGFGERSGIPLPGEAAGNLRHYRRWYDMDAATISFGQGMSATTLQLALAMGAIANGGELMEPILVRRVRHPGGEVVEDAAPRVRRRVLSEGNARLVADMLTAVTGPGGTGEDAAIEGYLVAGKTGTAQKADEVAGGYAEDAWVASFVGFAPADRPRIVIAVVIDEPVIAYYGGQVAGPVFRRVGEAALRQLGVPAATGGEALAAHTRARRAREREVEAAARAAAASAREARLDAPDPPPSGALAVAAPDPVVTPRAAEGDVVVPDLAGKGARAAVVALGAVGLHARLEGAGVVVHQEPAAGAVVRAAAPVRVILATPGVVDDASPELIPVAGAPELAMLSGGVPR